jgi:hypothetical protein
MLIVDQVVDSAVADQQMPAKERLFGLESGHPFRQK